MSSMLKKGTGAFKPKAPIARRRPPTNTSSQGAAQPEAQPAAISAQELPPNSPKDVAISSASESRTEQPPPSAIEDKTDTTSATIITDTPPAPPSEPATTTESAEGLSSSVPKRVTAASKAAPAKTKDSEVLTQDDSLSDPSHPAEPPELDERSVTVESSSGHTDDPASSTREPAALATPSTTQDTTNTSPSKSTSAAKDTRKPGPKSAKSATVVKPRPVAEATAPEPPSIRAPLVSPPPSGDVVPTPSIENNNDSSSAPATTKKTRKTAVKQPRKRKSAAATVESELETGAKTEGPPKKRRAPRRKRAPTGTVNGANTAEGTATAEDAAPKRRSQRKRKIANHAEENTEIEADTGQSDAGSEFEEEEGSNKQKKRRRKRAVTPENAEELTIDPEIVTMGHLTKDLKTGKRWERYGDVQKAEQDRKRELKKARLIKLGLLNPGDELPNEDGSEAGTPARDTSTPAPAPPPRPPPAESGANPGLKMRIVDGQIIIDQDSTALDRHAEAARERGDVETREENEFSKRMTQITHMKRPPQANFWTSEETQKFYHGLRMFGTDFNTIAKMFGGAKTRRQVKLKFNREERANPTGVNSCLIGEKEVPMDLEAVEGADGLEDSQAINDELAQLREEREAEARRLDEEAAAEARRKREELFGKRKGDSATGRDKRRGGAEDNNDADTDVDVRSNGAALRDGDRAAVHQETHPADKYGVGTDPDVIDETDLVPLASARGRGGRGRGGGGRGGRRGGKVSQVFASGFGV